MDENLTRDDIIRLMDARELARNLVRMTNPQPTLFDHTQRIRIRIEAWRYIGSVNQLMEGKDGH